MKKEEFKEFVKKNPILLKHVKNGTMTWQKFYEIFDMYGEDDNVWKDYLYSDNQNTKDTSSVIGLIDFVKNLDIESIQNGVTSMQRVLSLLQDMSNKNTADSEKTNYTARPLYKHFED